MTLRSAEAQAGSVAKGAGVEGRVVHRGLIPTERARHGVATHGVQLKREQILVQYDRYNASETADAATQKVLGRGLDVSEKKDSAVQK